MKTVWRRGTITVQEAAIRRWLTVPKRAWTWSAAIFQQAVAATPWLTGNKGPGVCQQKPLYNPYTNHDTQHKASWIHKFTIVLPDSEATICSLNWDRENQTAFVQSSSSRVLVDSAPTAVLILYTTQAVRDNFHVLIVGQERFIDSNGSCQKADSVSQSAL